MDKHKYVALDVDSANIVAGVYDSKGVALMECCLRNNGQVLGEFFKTMTGTVHVTFEEGTQAVWLYGLIRPLVAEVIATLGRTRSTASPSSTKTGCRWAKRGADVE